MTNVLAFPGKRVSQPRLYLAGKMDPDGWRSQIVPALASGLNGVDASESWPSLPFVFEGVAAQYVGPYFMDCGHGCYFGPGQHGFGVNQEDYENCGAHSSEQILETAAARRRYVSERCLRGMRAADIIFFWLDDMTAYGSLVELGFARALPGKTIVIATPEPQLELWFAYQMADMVMTSFNPADAVSQVLNAYAAHGGNAAAWTGTDAIVF